nr:hypothetical protein [Tanacetum cinerariifolium]GEW54739.1 hypothetical protein [Tanacetum cinerariifolium]
MFYKKNVDFVELVWEDFMFQIDNKQSTTVRRSNMPYPRFTKAIIRHFITKDKTISIRNNLFMHGVSVDSVLGFMKFISMYEIRQTGGSSKGAGFKPKVLDESKGKTKDTNEGAGLKLEVLDVSTDQESKYESWGNSKDEGELKNKDERTEFDIDKSIDLQNIDDEKEVQDDEWVHTPYNYVPTDDETQDVDDEEYNQINKELYDDVNVEMKDAEHGDKGKGDEKLTDIEQKQALFETMIASKSFNNHPKHMALYHALMELIFADEDAIDQGDDTSKQTTDEAALKQDFFKKPTRPPTPDPEWNTSKSVDDGLAHNWLNDLANTEKPPLTFDELKSNIIDFSSFAMNRLTINKLTKAGLVGLIYNLLKGTCKSYVELKYNLEECYRALSYQLNWNNPEVNRCPYDLSKPLSLQKV